MASRKRKTEDLVNEKGPTKRQKKDFASYDKDDIRQWATNNEIAPSQASYIARVFTPKQLLAISEQELLAKYNGPHQLSGVSIGRLLAATKIINHKGTNTPTSSANEHNAATSMKTETTFSTKFPYDDDLNTKEGVLNWLNRVVDSPPKQFEVSDILQTVGANFPHCVSLQTKQRIYRAALDSHGASQYNKESLQIPFINGAPGIGKTRMALETLNILKECALASKAVDPTEASLKQVLNAANCAMLYTSFGNGFSLTNNDDLFWRYSDCSGVVTLRALWKSYLQPRHNIRFDQVPVTQAMAQYLTLDALVDRLRELGVQYIVLAIDEMNMLHDTNFDNFRKTIMSLGNVMLRHFKDLFVVFASIIHTPLKKVITASLGIAVSISPSLFSLHDIEHILDASVARFPYLANWQLAGNFRRCVADLSNPPRVFDFLMVEINKQIKKNPSKDIFTLQYDTFMRTVIEKANDKISSDIDPTAAKFLINCCLTKKEVKFNSRLPKDGKTVEEVTREGYAYIQNATSSLNVQLSVPFFNLFTWLTLDSSVFGCAEHLFKFAWNDPDAIGPSAWEKFNVKYTSFKLTLLRNDVSTTIPLKTFHSGALFGVDCDKYFVQPRFAVPVSYIDQFPASFNGVMESTGLTELVPTSTRHTKLYDSVCLNGKNTTGIDAFYWLSQDVIEFQQYKANEIDSKNPTKLTQKELDDEYEKAKKLFDLHLARLNYQFVFGLVSNRTPEDGLTLQPNMYVVHQGNMEEYYGPLAGVAQIKAFTSVNVNTDKIPQLMKIRGVSQSKAEQIAKLREKESFKNMQDLRKRVKGVFENQAGLLIEF